MICLDCAPQPYYVWTCQGCGDTTLVRGTPLLGVAGYHKARGFEQCKLPWSYIEVGSVVQGPSHRFYMKAPPKARRKRRVS